MRRGDYDILASKVEALTAAVAAARGQADKAMTLATKLSLKK